MGEPDVDLAELVNRLDAMAVQILEFWDPEPRTYIGGHHWVGRSIDLGREEARTIGYLHQRSAWMAGEILRRVQAQPWILNTSALEKWSKRQGEIIPTVIGVRRCLEVIQKHCERSMKPAKRQFKRKPSGRPPRNAERDALILKAWNEDQRSTWASVAALVSERYPGTTASAVHGALERAKKRGEHVRRQVGF